MADITVTAANVRPDTTKGLVTGLAGGAITAGQLCYQDATLGTWLTFDADTGTPNVNLVLGIAMNSAPAAAQPVSLQSAAGADVTIGGTVVSGTSYWASGTAGGISIGLPTTGQNATLVGLGISATKIRLLLNNFATTAV